MSNLDPDEIDPPSAFETDGIRENEDESDKKLFQEIKDIVYQHVTKGGHDYVPDQFVYRASSIGVCSRKIVLEKNLDKYLDEEDMIRLPLWYQERISDDREQEFGAHVSGQVIHEVVQDALKDRIHSMELEVSKKIGDALLKGHYDLLVEYDNGEQVVIDIKSTRTPRKYLPNKKHLRQLMAYQGMLGGIKGALLYVDRDKFTMSYVSQEFSQEVFAQIGVKVIQLAKYEENGELPPPIPEFDEECINYSFKCQFYDYCFPADEVDDENSQEE